MAYPSIRFHQSRRAIEVFPTHRRALSYFFEPSKHLSLRHHSSPFPCHLSSSLRATCITSASVSDGSRWNSSLASRKTHVSPLKKKTESESQAVNDNKGIAKDIASYAPSDTLIISGDNFESLSTTELNKHFEDFDGLLHIELSSNSKYSYRRLPKLLTVVFRTLQHSVQAFHRLHNQKRTRQSKGSKGLRVTGVEFNEFSQQRLNIPESVLRLNLSAPIELEKPVLLLSNVPKDADPGVVKQYLLQFAGCTFQGDPRVGRAGKSTFLAVFDTIEHAMWALHHIHYFPTLDGTQPYFQAMYFHLDLNHVEDTPRVAPSEGEVLQIEGDDIVKMFESVSLHWPKDAGARWIRISGLPPIDESILKTFSYPGLLDVKTHEALGTIHVTYGTKEEADHALRELHRQRVWPGGPIIHSERKNSPSWQSFAQSNTPKT